MNRKTTIYIGLLLVMLVAFLAYWLLLSSNTLLNNKTKFVYIPSGCSDTGFKRIVLDSNVLKGTNTFFALAGKMGLWGHVKAGRYAIKPGMGNYALVKMFRSGQQEPVKVVINKLRTAGSFFQKLNNALEADSAALASAFTNKAYLQGLQLTLEQMPAVIVPATYEVWWNAQPYEVAKKFSDAYQVFWNTSRRQAATTMGLSISEVVTIASIVEEETNQNDEKEDVASVYLNRWRKGMKLDADPTVKFAVGDFSLRRILNIHTQFPSPYNTYLVAGIPPGPICTPSPSSIDAVLANKQTNYLFFCAREDFNGHHNFAATYEQHLANARKYQQALNQRGIH
jgi:UPF0755 protein